VARFNPGLWTDPVTLCNNGDDDNDNNNSNNNNLF
jgi:hypothetical protein